MTKFKEPKIETRISGTVLAHKNPDIYIENDFFIFGINKLKHDANPKQLPLQLWLEEYPELLDYIKEEKE